MEPLPKPETSPPQIGGGAFALENAKMKTLLKKKDAEVKTLTLKISRLEQDLVVEIGTSGDLAVEIVKMREVIREKDAKIQQLEKALLSKDRAQNDQRQRGSDSFIPDQKKVLQLFPDVLKILIERDRSHLDSCVRWRDQLPMLTACRLVCKSWRNSVDLVMLEDPSHIDLCPKSKGFYQVEYKQDCTPCPLRLSYHKFNSIQWDDKLKIVSTLQKRNPNNFSPIPTHHLMLKTVIDHDSNKWNKYCRMVTRYLQVLGKQVWYLTVHFIGSRVSDKSRDAAVVYNLLSTWFPLLPNLKSMSLYTWIARSDMENFHGFENDVAKLSFPKFDNLISFQGYRDSPLTYKILKRNRHIKKLGLSTDFDGLPSPNFMDVDFPNLTTFKCSFHSPEDWAKFINVTWKLEEITVGFHHKMLTTREFFGGLAKFGNALTSLTFNLSHHLPVFRGSEEVKLNLPQLKCLNVTYHDWNERLETILIQLKNLESFVLELEVNYDNFMGFEDRLLDSARDDFVDKVNKVGYEMDWMMQLPKLKCVKVTVNFNGYDLGDQHLFDVRRPNMPSVRFDVVKIKKSDLWK